MNRARNNRILAAVALASLFYALAVEAPQLARFLSL